MSDTGFLQIRNRIYHFQTMRCVYNGRDVDIEGIGKKITMNLYGLPIGGSMTPEELVGKDFTIDARVQDDCADALSESQITIGSRCLVGDKVIRVACRGYDPINKRLTVDFEVILRDVETEGRYRAEGMVTGDLIVDFRS